MVQWQLHPTGATMKKLLLLFFLFFTTLYANTTALPTLVPQGESLKDFNKTYCIDKRSPINAVAISEDRKNIVSGSGDMFGQNAFLVENSVFLNNA